jgi:putative hydrolase of the HAD superfamily
MYKVSAVLFDLYGTLLVYGNMSHAFSLWHRDLALAIRKAGGDVNEKKVAALCRGFFSWKIPENPEFSAYEERVILLAEQCGITPGAAWVKETSATSMDGWQTEVTLHPGALPLLKELRAKGIRTGVISNFEHYPHVRKVLAGTGLYQVLDATIISGEVHLKKPDPRIFELALQKLSAKAPQALFVGDDPQRDVNGAKSIGMQTWLFTNGAPLAPLLPQLEAI